MTNLTILTRGTAAIAAAVVLAACDAPSQAARLRSEVDVQERRWNALGIHSYAIDTRVSGGFIAPNTGTDSMHVIVRADVIQSVYDLSAGAYVSTTYGVTVPQLFAEARSAIADGTYDGGDTRAIIQFDPAYDFPTVITSGMPDVGGRQTGNLLPNIP